MADDTEIRSLTCTTSDGLSLEAELALPGEPAEGHPPVTGSVVLAHPHPLHGGSMTSLVTGELFRALPRSGLAALRFNFRGVGASEGEHGHGEAEALDVVAAIDALAAATPLRPLVVCGWSFGADVSLGVTDERLAGWVVIAPPLRFRPAADYDVVGHDPRPKLIIVPEHDEFRSPASAAEATADWVNTTLEVVPGADHFLVGRTDKAARLVIDFIASL
ncbi:alpha/beta hydrolase [Rhabdothermincola salaria]|uniref:alpha/beta hydrolase n=1 Tax=Rhabdothermincola salaria TaxID=2903142 RepID=UPI001E363076|nr:alpha/beta hydrolase [Rhabdothermincola salaria]